MNDETPLAHRLVLVVDDDFYLAEDTRETLMEAGATVLGPYGRADEALASLETTLPNCAVLDLNLGSGPEFGIARALMELHIPMVLVTGYDHDIIPPDLAGMASLQKPVSRDKLVATVRDLVRKTGRFLTEE